MQPAFVLLFAAAAVSACSSKGSHAEDRLAGACQVRKCACGPEGWSPFMAGGNVPVLWRENGDAYCPDGYVLHLIEPAPMRR